MCMKLMKRPITMLMVQAYCSVTLSLFTASAPVEQWYRDPAEWSQWELTTVFSYIPLDKIDDPAWNYMHWASYATMDAWIKGFHTKLVDKTKEYVDSRTPENIKDELNRLLPADERFMPTPHDILHAWADIALLGEKGQRSEADAYKDRLLAKVGKKYEADLRSVKNEACERRRQQTKKDETLLTELENQRSKLEQEKKSLEAELAQVKKASEKSSKQNNELEKQLKGLQAQYEGLNAEVAKKVTENANPSAREQMTSRFDMAQLQAHDDALSKEVDQKDARIRNLQQEIDSLKSRQSAELAAELQARSDDVSQELRQLLVENEEATNCINSLTACLREQNKRIGDLRNANNALIVEQHNNQLKLKEFNELFTQLKQLADYAAPAVKEFSNMQIEGAEETLQIIQQTLEAFEELMSYEEKLVGQEEGAQADEGQPKKLDDDELITGDKSAAEGDDEGDDRTKSGQGEEDFVIHQDGPLVEQLGNEES